MAGTEISIMSVDQVQHPLITCHHVEHPHAIGRRVKAGLTLVGAAAAGVFALILTSPTALAGRRRFVQQPVR
jgi:hypothetical protein